jgi:hypothetical protein
MAQQISLIAFGGVKRVAERVTIRGREFDGAACYLTVGILEYIYPYAAKVVWEGFSGPIRQGE